MQNLLGPEPTLLPDDPAAAELAAGVPADEVARRHPASSVAWAAAAADAREADAVLAWYAFARVGYHRGLDALRRNGWKGHGPVPWEHEPNRGFLRCLAELSAAADAISEEEEARRCSVFLTDSSPEAAALLDPIIGGAGRLPVNVATDGSSDTPDHLPGGAGRGHAAVSADGMGARGWDGFTG